MGKEIVNQVQKAQGISGRISQRRNTLRHTIIKLTKIKDRAVLSRSVVSNSLLPHGLQPMRFLCPWGFSRQEYWSGLPCPPPGNLPNPGIKSRSPTLQVDSLLAELPLAIPQYKIKSSKEKKLFLIWKKLFIQPIATEIVNNIIVVTFTFRN